MRAASWLGKAKPKVIKTHQSRTSQELRDFWLQYLRGWWGYFQLAEDRTALFRLEVWIRRHIRKCFCLRWHDAAGRENALRRLGIVGRRLKGAFTGRGAWHMSRTGPLQSALSNSVLRRYGFSSRRCNATEFNRRMRKTARPVVWEGDRAA